RHTIGVDIVAHATDGDVGEIRIEAFDGEILVETPARHAAPGPVVVIIRPAPTDAGTYIKAALKRRLVVEIALAGSIGGLSRRAVCKTGETQRKAGGAENACCVFHLVRASCL